MSGFANNIRLAVAGALLNDLSMRSPTLDRVSWFNLLTANPTNDGDDFDNFFFPTDHVEWPGARKAIYGPYSTSPPAGAARWSYEFASQPQSVQYQNLDPITWDSSELTAITEEIAVVGMGLFTRETEGYLFAWDKFDEPITVRPSFSYTFPTGHFKLVLQGIE